MTLILKNMTVQANQTNADVGAAFGDDLYLRINGNRFPIFNLSTSGFADQGFGFRPLQIGSALTGSGAKSSDQAVISLFDKDGVDVDGFTGLFEGGDDFIGSALLLPDRLLHRTFTIQGEDSSYGIKVDVEFGPIGPLAGKVASKAGGVMNGSNTAGTLVGLGGKDIINANNGNDIVLGGNNDDILNGGNGNDILFGGNGKDTLKGGAGADVFVIAPKTGLDTVKDFRDGEDLIGLGNNLSFQDLTFVQQAKGTLIKAGSEKLAFLQGVSSSQLTAIDFTQVNLSDLNGSAKALLASAH